MESVKLFYCVKRCDETDCFNKHIRKIHKIQDYIVECFKAHVVRDKLFNYVFLARSDRDGSNPYTIPRLRRVYSYRFSKF